jgi:hypothetical protein
MMTRFYLAVAAIVALAAGFAVAASDEPRKSPGSPQIQVDKSGKPTIDTGALAKTERELAEKYSVFLNSLLTLQQRLANSKDEKDKARAAQLEKILRYDAQNDVAKQFSQYVKFLSESKTGLGSSTQVQEAVRQSAALAKDLREILELLKSDDGLSSNKEKRLALEAIAKELDRAIRDQIIVRERIANAQDVKPVGDDQADVTKRTSDIITKLSPTGKADPKDMKSQSKEAGRGSQAGSKDEGKQGQVAGDNEKAGQGKSPKENQSTAKQTDDKQGGKPKSGEGAESAKAGGAKSGEGSKADSSQSKAGSASPPQQGQSKSGSESKGQGSAKSGQPSDQPQAAGESKGGSDNNQAGQPQDNVAATRKKIQEGNDYQRQTEDNIGKEKKAEAGRTADEAIAKLEQARKRLEDLIRQLREEELERVITALINRCAKMLAMQEEVLRGTLTVKGQIENSQSKKADRDHVLASLHLSDDELKIVHEATKAIELLETEGTAVAFPEVFQQVREDMKHVHRRLKGTDVGDVTVAIEEDVIETLKEMIKALEKAKKDLDTKKNQAKSPEGEQPPNQDQKLLDKIAELKMIKSMQLRVNSRTELYGQRYAGEQAISDDIRAELRELAGRQERIFEVATKIAKGDNQ